MNSRLLPLIAQADQAERLSHSVARLIWDTSFDDRQQAHRLQQELSRWSNTALNEILEQAFQQHCPAGQTWRIDKLELDLGEIAFDDLSTELPKRLRACLSEQLRRLLLNADRQTQNPGLAELKNGLHSASQILSQAHSLNDYIDCFLRNGVIPWWYTGNQSHTAILQQQLQNAPRQIAAIIRKAGKAEAVRKRIVWQYPHHALKKIITVLEPQHHDYIVAFADQLTDLQAKTQQPHSDSILFERQSLLWILTHLLVDRGSLFNTVFFVESTLKQMAHCYQLDYLTLLRQLTNAAQSVEYKSLTTPQFIQALLAVQQKAVFRSERDATGEPEIDYWQQFARNLRSERQLSANGEEIGNLGELFNLLVGEDAAQMTELLKQEGLKAKVRQKLINHLSQAELSQVVSLLAPQDHSFILAHAQRSRELLTRHKTDQRLVWEVILAYLLKNSGSYFNRRQFVDTTLQEISRARGIDYLMLLDMLSATSMSYRRFELLAILSDLKQQNQARQQSQQQSDGVYSQVLAAYLSSGHMPKVIANSYLPEPGQLFSILLCRRPEQLAEVIAAVFKAGPDQGKTGSRPSKIQRLLGLIQPVDFPLVLRTLDAQAAKFSVDLIEQLSRLQRQQQLPSLNGFDLAYQVYGVVLDVLIRGLSSNFTVARFLPAFFAELTANQGINGQALAAELLLSYSRDTIKNNLSEHDNQALRQWLTNNEAGLAGISADAAGAHGHEAFLSQKTAALWYYLRRDKAGLQRFGLVYEPETLAGLLAALLPDHADVLLERLQHQRDRNLLMQALLKQAELPLLRQWLNTLWPMPDQAAAEFLSQWHNAIAESGLWRGASTELQQKLHDIFWLSVLSRALITQGRIDQNSIHALLAEVVRSSCEQLHIGLERLTEQACLTQAPLWRASVLRLAENPANSEADRAAMTADPQRSEGALNQKIAALWCYLRRDKAGLQGLGLVYEPETLAGLLAALLPAHADVLLERLQHQRDSNLLAQALLKQAELPQLRQWLNTLWPTADQSAAELLSQWQKAIAASGLWQGASTVLQQKLHDIFWLSIVDRALIKQGRIDQNSIHALLAEVVRLSCYQLYIGLERLTEQVCLTQAPLWQATVVRLAESRTEALSGPALNAVIAGKADAENNRDRLAETNIALPVQTEEQAFLQDSQGRYLRHPLLPELCRYVLMHGRAPLWLVTEEPLNLAQLIADLLQSEARLLRRIVQSVRLRPAALLRLHHLIDYRDLLAAVVQTEPELKALSAMLEQFYQGLLQLRFSAIDRALPASLLWQSTLQAWLSGDWQGLSAQHIAAELSGELIRRYAISAAQVEAEFKRNERHFPAACRLTLPPEQFESQANGFHRRQNGNLTQPKQSQSNSAAITKNKPVMAAIPTKPTTEQSMPIPINNAGLVLLQGFIGTYFSRLALVKDQAFVSEQARRDAVHHLQYLATGFTDTEEQHLVLNKLLCGLSTSEPIEPGIKLTAEQMQTGDSLIKAVINHWTAIGSSSINGFRGNWLVRNGLLSQSDERWDLLIEKRPYDLLLQKSPFSYGIINLPWMAKPLYVTWPT